MAEIDARAYRTTAGNAADTTPNDVETQQPGGSGNLRQVVVLGDPTTRTSMQKITADGGAQIAGTQPAVSSTAWTSATGANTANSISVVSYNTVSVAVVATSTVTGGVLTFEVSPDNTNWIPIAMARVDNYSTDLTYTILASTNRAWSTSVDGFTNFRVRLSTAITGTATVTVLVIPQTFAIEPIVNTGIPNDNFTSGTAAALNAAVTLTPINGASSVVAILSGAPVATAVLEATGDGTNWSTLPFMQIDSTIKTAPDNTLKTSINANLNPTIVANIAGSQQVRLRLSAYTSGTSTITLRATSGVIITPPIATNTDANSWAGNTGDGWPLGAQIPFIYNGSSYDRYRSVVNATNSTGTGITAAGLLAQLDDTSPTAITENQFGNLRITPERALHTSPRPSTNSGYTPGQLISAATTNATSVKASAGTVGYITASNVNAAARYLKIYNKASAPTVGTDTPVHTFLIPGNTAGAGTNIPLPPQGINLATGFAFAITTGVAVADTGAVAASELVINYGYI